MLRSLILSLLLLLSTALHAQIAVESFELDEFDLTANRPATQVFDLDGNPCALIKVETTLKGLTFDTGMLAIMKSDYRVGEIWLYVPRGVRYISIFHPDLGVLRKHDLGMSVQKAKTYILKLRAGTVKTIVEEAVTSQFLVIQVEPANATVIVNNEVWPVNDGVARKYVPFGDYQFSVMAPDYVTHKSAARVADPENNIMVKVQLKPNFVPITVNVGLNADIWIDGERRGSGIWTGNLGAGDHRFEARKDGYISTSQQQTVNIEEGAKSFTLTDPTPIYGRLMVNTLPDLADIYIDGEKVGQTPKAINKVVIGTRKVTIRKEGYEDFTKDVIISEGQTASVDGQMTKSAAPTSVYAGQSLNANSIYESSPSSSTQSFVVNGVSFSMVAVSGGTFQMGATREQLAPWNDEKPVHSVTLSNYYIGESEVTQALWIAVMGQNPSKIKGDNLPVEKVSWKDCQVFIQKLNQLTGKNFRLPTEAEWEYAARGGKESKGYQHSGSNELDKVAWYNGNCNERTHAVKTLQPNELGVYDMNGNVWEWCQDVYADYVVNSQTNPTGPTSGSERVLRGGSWDVDGRRCRITNRTSESVKEREEDYGFRLAL
ncbi:MAG: SUMF1/EgtB/PvdO family nonheme iron enzyme [Bacteroidales bacterium]|nr:SUMF1/EgtB/PvdO family nonheme iron enzyme [Candidatus Liminaster caballi]